MSALFQLRLRKHLGKIVVLSILISLINYLLLFNGAVKIGFISPIFSILVTFLYLSAIVRIPTIWSFVATVTGGNIAPLVVQLAIIFASFGFFSPSELKEHIWRNYALDTTSGIVFCLVAFLLYFQGWSFKFDFEKIRFKWERYIVIIISLVAAVVFPATLIYTRINDFTLSLTFLSGCSFIIFIFLLGYAVKKEREEIKSLNSYKEVE